MVVEVVEADSFPFLFEHVRSLLLAKKIDPDKCAVRSSVTLSRLEFIIQHGTDRDDDSKLHQHAGRQASWPDLDRFIEQNPRLASKDFTFFVPLTDRKHAKTNSQARRLVMVFKFLGDNNEPLWELVDSRHYLYTPKAGLSYKDLLLFVVKPHLEIDTLAKHPETLCGADRDLTTEQHFELVKLNPICYLSLLPENKTEAMAILFVNKHPLLFNQLAQDHKQSTVVRSSALKSNGLSLFFMSRPTINEQVAALLQTKGALLNRGFLTSEFGRHGLPLSEIDSFMEKFTYQAINLAEESLFSKALRCQ